MAEFVCKYGTATGEIVQRTHVADSEQALRNEMEQQGYYVFGIKRKLDVASLMRVFKFRRSKVSDKKFMVFNQELAALIHAGLPLLRSLELLMDRTDDPYFSGILRDVYQKVKGGGSLSDAFGDHPDVFPKVYVASILAGEKSATLEQVIRRYMNYMRIIMAIRTKVVSSLIYPLLLLALSFGVIGLLVGYVIPKFSEFYQGFSSELPTITQMIIGLSIFVREYTILILLVLVALVVSVRYYLLTSQTARLFADRWKLKLPYFGRIWTKFSTSQLMRTLHTLLAGGIPLVNAVDVAASSVGNLVIATELSKVSQRVKEGDPLWQGLQSTGLITPMAVEMIKVGEETASLEEMLKNIADFYDEEIDTSLTNILAIVEPIMLIFMGFVIAALLLAMYYPLFSIITTVR